MINLGNYRVAAKITEYHILSKLIKINLPMNHHLKIRDNKAITSCKK